MAESPSRSLHDLLEEKPREYGTVHVYEETPNWTLATYLSNWCGIGPDLQQGSSFDSGPYATGGDSCRTKLLYYQRQTIAPVWPASPDETRCSIAENRSE